MPEDTYTVVRSTTIAAPPPAVYEHVADFHRWRAWSPWEGIDPTMERTFSAADSGRGAVYAHLTSAASWSGAAATVRPCGST